MQQIILRIKQRSVHIVSPSYTNSITLSLRRVISNAFFQSWLAVKSGLGTLGSPILGDICGAVRGVPPRDNTLGVVPLLDAPRGVVN